MKAILVLILVLIFFGFMYAFFWHIPRYWYKNSKTKLRFFIKVFLHFTIPLILYDYGITFQQGLIESAKEIPTKSKHAWIIKYIEAGINRCQNIDSNLNSPFKLPFDCSALNEVSSYQNVVKALKDAGFKNAYQTNKPAVIYSSSEPALGMTSIFYKDSKIYIKTNYLRGTIEKVIDINL